MAKFKRNGRFRATLNTATEYVTSGLVFRLDASSGLVTSGGDVTSWTEDGGGLVFEPVTVTPTIASSPAGATVIGGGGLRELATTGLPTGSAARTLMFCWRPAVDEAAFGGFGWGSAINDQAFKILANPSNEIALDVFNDSTVIGTVDEAWKITTAAYDGTTVRVYEGATEIGDGWVKALNTGTTQTDIMLSFSGNVTNGDVGAVFVYNRVLTPSEITQNANYLNARFINDVFAPTITGFALSNPTSVTLDWQFESSEAGTFDLVVTQSSTTPTREQIELGQDHLGNPAAYSLLNQTMVAGVRSGIATGLSASTTYYAHLAAQDNIPNAQAVQSTLGASTSVADATAPVFSVTTTTPGVSGVTVVWATNEGNGTAYLYVSTNATESAATVKASGTSKAVTAAGTQSIDASGLLSNTAYYHHLLHEDAAGNADSVISTSFTTVDGAATTVGVYSDAITWTFDTAYTTGTYWNGDPYVVRPPGGSVRITATTPTAQGSNTSPASTGANRVRHGAVLNWNTGSDASMSDGGLNAAGRMFQGFDSHQPDGIAFSPYDSGIQDDPALTGSNIVVSAEGAVMKANSKPDPIPTGGSARGNILSDVGILTIVDSAPPANAFRPGAHTLNKAHRWTTADVDFSLVPSGLTAPAGTPTYSSASSKVLRHHLMGSLDYNRTRSTMPSNHMRNYGTDNAEEIHEAILFSMTDAATTEQRETIIKSVVQIGIDVYDRYVAGGRWHPNGGLYQGYKFPLVVAATLLNDAGMKAVADVNPTASPVSEAFAEDRAIFYVSGGDVGRTLSSGREQYIASDVGNPEWGEQHTFQNARDNRAEWAAYRQQASAWNPGAALAIQMITGAKTVWNWQAFFDYADRLMVRNFFVTAETLSFGGTIYGVSYPLTAGYGPSPFTRAMWTTYRASYGGAIWDR